MYISIYNHKLRDKFVTVLLTRTKLLFYFCYIVCCRVCVRLFFVFIWFGLELAQKWCRKRNYGCLCLCVCGVSACVQLATVNYWNARKKESFLCDNLFMCCVSFREISTVIIILLFRSSAPLVLSFSKTRRFNYYYYCYCCHYYGSVHGMAFSKSKIRIYIHTKN